MYGKVFGSLYEGSMRGRLELQAVFIYMLANCNDVGTIDVVPRVIADAIGLDLERVTACIAELEAPDPDSRSPEQAGARIERLDGHRTWGWSIVNYEKYRDLRNARERKLQTQRATAKWRASKSVSNGEHSVSNGEHGEPKQKQKQITKDLVNGEAVDRFENVFWPVYPRKVAKAAALKAWKAQRIHTQDQIDRVMLGLIAHIERVWPGKESEFIPHPATWINGRRWEDDLIVKVAEQPVARKAQLEKMRQWRESWEREQRT